MQTTTKIILAVCSIGAVAIGTLTPANAQYYPPPGYSPLPLPGDDGAAGFRYDHHLTWDGCPPGYTVQGHRSLRSGNWEEYCARCEGPGVGFWNGYWNGCPFGYTAREIRRIRRNGGY